MWSIYKKEIASFLSSLIGYVVIGVFLLILGLFMWVFPDYSILDYHFATLDQLFEIAPIIFLFLIPAITMRSFAEEIQTGTIELLATRPLKEWEIVGGKFLAAWTLVAIAILPTLFYYLTVYTLGSPAGNIDDGATIGSYIGLLLLGGVFVSIGIFSSSLTANQIVSFIVSMFLCFFVYWAFFYLSKLPIFLGKTDSIIQMLGIEYHYQSISRGIIDTRDIVYFFSVMAAFLLGTQTSLQRKRT